MSEVAISFMIPPELKRTLENLTADDDRSLSNYVMLALMDHVRNKGIDLETIDKKPKK